MAAKLAPMTSVPTDGGVTVTAQVATPRVVGASTQLVAERPDPVKATVPVGLEGVPVPCVSVTVTVTDVDGPKTMGLAPKVIEVSVLRPFTVSWNVWVAVCGVPDVASVTFTVKVEFPEAEGVPEMTPPVESVSPAGSVLPGVRAHVSGALPPSASRVVL